MAGDPPILCARCSAILTPGQGDFYVVRIEAFADPTPPDVPDMAGPSSRGDFAAEMRALIAQMQHLSEQELMDQVYRRLTLHLCRRCYQGWIENPVV